MERWRILPGNVNGIFGVFSIPPIVLIGFKNNLTLWILRHLGSFSVKLWYGKAIEYPLGWGGGKNPTSMSTYQKNLNYRPVLTL